MTVNLQPTKICSLIIISFWQIDFKNWNYLKNEPSYIRGDGKQMVFLPLIPITETWKNQIIYSMVINTLFFEYNNYFLNDRIAIRLLHAMHGHVCDMGWMQLCQVESLLQERIWIVRLIWLALLSLYYIIL